MKRTNYISDMSVKNEAFKNIIWRFAERCGAKGVTFIVTLVLARILTPDAYGTVALITVITNILQVFVDSGLGCALIQKKDADELDFSSVFYFNMIICTGLYVCVFLVAPFMGRFYGIPELTPLTRFVGLTLIISGLKNVQQAYVSRNLLFKKFFFSTLGGTIISAVLGIYLASAGYGAWAIAVQMVSNTAIDTLILWLTVRWRPIIAFSFDRLKTLFNFGWKLLVSGLLDTAYNNLSQFFIGKMYNTSDLGYYNKGQQLPYQIITNLTSSIDSVLLPVMSANQDDVHKVKNITRRSMKTGVYVVSPIMAGMAFAAPVLVEMLLTSKWLPCVPYIRIFCISYMFYPLATANLNALKAVGRSDLFLKLEIAKKILGFSLLAITIWFGPLAMAYSILIAGFGGQIINSWPNKKLLDYGYLEQLKDILPTIALAVIMGVCISFCQYLNIHIILIFVIQVISGIIIYLLGSVILKLDSLEYVYKLVKSLIRVKP